MLKIRLQRVGRKNEPTFRIVLTDSKNSTKSGKLLEVLGSHDPRHKEKTQLKTERITYWMSKGAQVTPTMHNMLITKKVIEGKKINVLPRKQPIVKEGAKEDQKAGAATTSEPAAKLEPVAPATEPTTPTV